MESTSVVSPIRLPRSSETSLTGKRVTNLSLTLLDGEVRQTIGLPRRTSKYGEIWLPETKSMLPSKSAFSAADELSQNSKLTLSPIRSQILALSMTSQIGKWEC